MSNTRYGWWGYAKDMIRRYPALRKEYDEMLEQNIVPHYSAVPGGGGATRKVEGVALRTLPKPYQQELESVSSAVRHTQAFRDGDERIKLISLVYWKQTHTLSGAALQCNVDYSTAKRWHKDFVRCVGAFHGLLPAADRAENEKNLEKAVS